MMKSTPIEVLFHHGANCECEQCQQAVKPFRNGKFLTQDEIEQVNSDLRTLIDENNKLKEMLERLAEEKLAIKKELDQRPIVQEELPIEEKEEPKSPASTVTLVIDTSKLIYIAIIAILLIMVLKK